MRLPPLSAARCRITASISHKFFAAAALSRRHFSKEGENAMRKERQPIRVWAIIFWLIVWQLAAMALHAAYPHGALLLPSPLAALARLMALAGTAAFWRAIGTSSMHILGGFLLSCALAVVLAAFSARFSRVKELLAPLVAAVKTVPVASFIILALIWLSSRTLPLFIAALMVFPPVYLNVLEGIRRTDASLLEMARVFRVPVFAHAAGRVSAAGASLLPLCRQCGAGPLLEGRHRGGGHRPLQRLDR